MEGHQSWGTSCPVSFFVSIINNKSEAVGICAQKVLNLSHKITFLQNCALLNWLFSCFYLFFNVFESHLPRSILSVPVVLYLSPPGNCFCVYVDVKLFVALRDVLQVNNSTPSPWKIFIMISIIWDPKDPGALGQTASPRVVSQPTHWRGCDVIPSAKSSARRIGRTDRRSWMTCYAKDSLT